MEASAGCCEAVAREAAFVLGGDSSVQAELKKKNMCKYEEKHEKIDNIMNIYNE